MCGSLRIFFANQLVVLCGSGSVELIEEAGPHRKVDITTKRGARTGILAGNKLFVAVPNGETAAAIWEFSFG